MFIFSFYFVWKFLISNRKKYTSLKNAYQIRQSSSVVLTRGDSIHLMLVCIQSFNWFVKRANVSEVPAQIPRTANSCIEFGKLNDIASKSHCTFNSSTEEPSDCLLLVAGLVCELDPHCTVPLLWRRLLHRDDPKWCGRPVSGRGDRLVAELPSVTHVSVHSSLSGGAAWLSVPNYPRIYSVWRTSSRNN